MQASGESDLIYYDVVTMREIGVRKLKASLSEVLRSVQAGESVRVTVHGRAVADIVPPQRTSFEDRLNELEAQGRLTRSSGPLHPLPKLQPRRKGGMSASDMVIADRQDRDWEDDG